VQWSEIIGPNVLPSIPYAWWKSFTASNASISSTVESPINETAVQSRRETFPEFDQFY
jgi:hypothetical protein